MELSVSLYRYNPEQDKFPYMKNYKVKKPEKDIMVLDLLNMLKENDATISYRRSCREGVCGSDGMNINCLLYTSPSPRDTILSRMPSSA